MTDNILELGYSDHLAQVLIIEIDKPKANPQTVIRRDFSKRNLEIFKSDVQKELWEETYLHNDVNRSYNCFFNKFLYYLYTVFPKKTSKEQKT
jgi:hypothetical protein